MQLPNFHHRRLISAAALACAAALVPASALAATTSLAASAGAGQPATVPAGFQPLWAGFYSPASGLVLGTVGCQPINGKSCRARLVATADGGARWRSVTAPHVLLFNGAGDVYGQGSRVSGVVFASGRDGWLYGPGLYATHDGSGHWRRLFLGGGIDAMAASAGTVYAVVSPPGGKPEELFASPAGKNAWARVGTMRAARALLAVSGTAAWFASANVGEPPSGRAYVWATADGRHWHKYPVRCPASGRGRGRITYGLSSVAAASPADVLFLCTGVGSMHFSDKEVLASANGGKTAHLAGFAPTTGIGGMIAVPPHRPGLITLATEYAVDRSADGGKTWKTVLFNPYGASLTSLSYVTTTVGWAVEPEVANSRLMRTTDAGATWHQVPIASARPVTAYVVNQGNCDGGHTVTPINTATSTALKAINVGKGPNAIAVTPDGKTAYVVSGGFFASTCGEGSGPANTVTPIRTATGTALKAIKAGSFPGYIAITPDGKTAYVVNAGSNSGSGTVTPIRTATNTALRAIKAGSFPGYIAITPDGKTAYVASGNTVIPIRTATNTALTAIKVAGGPSAIAITPDGKTAYVTARAGVVPIRTATNTALTAVKGTAGANAIAITPNGKTAYVTAGAGVVPIRTATNTALTAIKGTSGADAIAITPDGKTAYVIRYIFVRTGYKVSVLPISTATNTAGRAIALTGDLVGIAITPDGKTAYVINDVSLPAPGPGFVIPIRIATNKAGKPIKVGVAPAAIAFTP